MVHPMGFHDKLFPLVPLRKEAADPNIIAFDTEDNGTGAGHNFICGCTYEGPDQQRAFWNREDMRQHIFRQHKYTTLGVAHNLSYDLNNLDYPEKTAERLHSRTKLIGAVWHYGNRKQMKILDTGNFFVGASIDSLGQQLGYQKLGCKCEKPNRIYNGLGICKTCGMFCVDYLRNKSQDEIPPEARTIIEEYCMRDSEICYKTMKKLISMTTQNKTRFKCFTAPSLAMRIFRTNHMSSAWKKRTMTINDIERLAYYGGRTEVFDYRHFDRVYAEDIRSSYPRAMHDEIYPRPSNVYRLKVPLEYALRYEGISLVTVEVPHMHIPPLPYRREDGKLLFPVGTWTGAYTHPEIKMAMRHGVKIKAIYESLLYPDTFRPFTEYVKTFYGKKEQLKKTKGLEYEFYKLLLNGLSGKWGEKRISSIHELADDPKLATLICQCTNHGIESSAYEGTNLCSNCEKPALSASTVEIVDGYVTIPGCRQPDPKNAFPILIAYITAYGRIKLFEDRLQYGNTQTTIIYTDTDSAMSEAPVENNVGENLGQWERLIYEDFIAYAPKFYDFGYTVYPDGTKKKGTLKLKGIPKRHEIIYLCPHCPDDAETPEPVWLINNHRCVTCSAPLDESCKRRKFERPLKVAEAERRHMNPNTWITIIKNITTIDDKRIKLKDGTSQPLTISGQVYPDFLSALTAISGTSQTIPTSFWKKLDQKISTE